MKILVVSASPWNNNNSFGISYSNIFKGIDGLEFANVSFSRRLEQTDDEIVSRSFQVTTKMLINNLLKREEQLGIEGHISTENHNKQNIEQTSAMKFAKRKRWKILFWLNDLIWSLGHWKSQELMDFIDDFKPDLIIQPIYFSSYLNDIAQFIKNYTKVPMIGYISDDCYTLRQFSLSPLYWIDRLYKRRKVKETIEQCELLYVISDIQKREYEKIFTPPCKILTKCADFTEEPPIKAQYNKPLQLVFTGNIGTNRWKTLALIADALNEINKDEIKAQLNIYTATPLTKKMIEKLNVRGSSFVKGPVPATEVKKIQEESDILVHVEGLDLKNRCLLHQSFSTKIVDYCKEARPIFAVAPHDVASIDELRKHDGAMIATTKKEIKEKLVKLISNKEILDEYSKKSYLCGRCNYSNEIIKNMLINDLNNIYKKCERKD